MDSGRRQHAGAETPPPRLVVNADDFGFTRDVNEGIVEAHRSGILTAATLMANGQAFHHAVALARGTPSLDVGCHIGLVQGYSVLKPGRRLPATPAALAAALALGRFPVEEEVRAQVREIVEAGIRPTHIDTHKHTHLLPAVLTAVARVAREFGIPWVRVPVDSPVPGDGIPGRLRLIAWGARRLRPVFDRILSHHGRRTTDYFTGFQLTGRLDAPTLVQLIRNLPAGSVELMCHPGYCTEELLGAPTRLKESRRRELEALTAPEVKEALEAAGVELVNYRQLGGFDE